VGVKEIDTVLAGADVKRAASQPPIGPNPVPTSRGGWGHEKPFKNNGVPNLTPWSQPFATHSCGRKEKVGKMFFYTKREGPPLGTPRLGPHPFKPLE